MRKGKITKINVKILKGHYHTGKSVDTGIRTPEHLKGFGEFEVEKNTYDDVKNLMFGRAVNDFKCYKNIYKNAKKLQACDNLQAKRNASDKMYLCALHISNLFNTTIQTAYELLENYNV